MKKRTIILYLIFIHAFLLAVLIKPEYVEKVYYKLGFIERPLDNHAYYMESLWSYFANRTKTLPKNSDQLIFLGNSITNSLCVGNLFNGINFGISGENLSRAKDRIKLLKNLDNKKVVLAYGVNDIPKSTIVIFNDYKKLISEIPKSATIYISSVLPINEKIYSKHWDKTKTNKQIKELNILLEDFANKNIHIHYLDTAKNLFDENGQLDKIYQKGDGIHLSEKGNSIWANNIKNELLVFDMNFKTQ